MTNPFRDSTFWLIGASTGIGRSLAIKIAPEVKKLYISARSEKNLKSLKDEIKLDNIEILPCDVSDLSSISYAYQQITKNQTLDFVLFNAGIYNPSNVLDFDLNDYLAHMDINYSGALRTCSLILPDFLKRQSGHIAVVSSVAGYRALPNAEAYGASKAALTYFFESMRMKVQDKGVKITIINPGFVETRLTEKNTFEMPFILSPEQAAEEIYNGISKGQSEIHFPKKFTIILKILGLLPEKWYRALMIKFVLKK